MLVIVFLELNYFSYFLKKNWKKIVILIIEILFLLVSILKNDFGWLFSLNLTLFWYPVFIIFWINWFNNLQKIKKNQWPLFLIWGSTKFIFYTLPFFAIFLGEKYLSNEIFKVESSLIGILFIFGFFIFQI